MPAARGQEAIFAEATGGYGDNVGALEPGECASLQGYAQSVWQRPIPRGVETHAIGETTLLLLYLDGNANSSAKGVEFRAQ